MANPKWYLLVDESTNTALEYLQLPQIWNEQTNISELNDYQLATLSKWSSANRGFNFLTLDAARAHGVLGIDDVLATCDTKVLAWLREMRDAILTQTDIAVTSDRWDSMDSVSKSNVSAFRKALRDITAGDFHNPVWPSIPKELDFLRKADFSYIARPSAEFKKMLEEIPPLQTADKIKEDKCIRLREYRDARKYGGTKISVNGADKWFWNDETSRTQYALLDNMIRRNNLPQDYVLGEWKTMNGEMLQMTVQMLYEIIDTGIMVEKELFRVAEEHRQAILTSTSPSDYDFTVGIPPTYDDEKFKFENF